MSWENINVEDFDWLGKIELVQSGIPLDVSGFTTKIFIFSPPSLPAFNRTAVFSTNGTDGWVEYRTVEGDIMEAGAWNVCARITKVGAELTADPVPFYVNRRCD